MKKILVTVLLMCVSLLHAQERFFLYGKVLGADGMPLPSAQISLTTVLEQQPITSTHASIDGSFTLVVSDHALVWVKMTGSSSDSFSLPILLTTEQHTLNLTVHLPLLPAGGSGIASQRAALQMQYGNTELGIAEKLLVSMMEEKRLVRYMAPILLEGNHPDPAAVSLLEDSGIHYRDPDTLLSSLEKQIRAEQNPLHRSLFLLRYIQLCAGTKRTGNPAIVKMVLNTIEPSSPFWVLVPELIKASASTPKEYGDYVRRVIALTPDPELKSWFARQ